MHARNRLDARMRDTFGIPHDGLHAALIETARLFNKRSLQEKTGANASCHSWPLSQALIAANVLIARFAIPFDKLALP